MLFISAFVCYLNTTIVSVRGRNKSDQKIHKKHLNTTIVSVRDKKLKIPFTAWIFKYNHCVGSSEVEKFVKEKLSLFKYNHCVGSSPEPIFPSPDVIEFKYNHCVGSRD